MFNPKENSLIGTNSTKGFAAIKLRTKRITQPRRHIPPQEKVEPIHINLPRETKNIINNIMATHNIRKPIDYVEILFAKSPKAEEIKPIVAKIQATYDISDNCIFVRFTDDFTVKFSRLVEDLTVTIAYNSAVTTYRL